MHCIDIEGVRFAPILAVQPKSMSVQSCWLGRRKMLPGLTSRWAYPQLCSFSSPLTAWLSACMAAAEVTPATSCNSYNRC